jgi:DNA-binding transcriptional regulator GbsR (MarR family)
MKAVRTVRNSEKQKDDYFDSGPLASILQGDPGARILDQALLLGNAEFTVSGMADGTGLSYKTVQSYLKHLGSIEWVIATRKMGNAQAYRFNIENHMNSFIKWATAYQKHRLADQ